MFGTSAQSYEKINMHPHLLSSFLGISDNYFMETFSQTFAQNLHFYNFMVINAAK